MGRTVKTIATEKRYRFVCPEKSKSEDLVVFDELSSGKIKEMEDKLGGEVFYKLVATEKVTYSLPLETFAAVKGVQREVIKSE